MEKFIGKSNVTMILGDNIFYGNGLIKILEEAVENKKRATIFGYYISDPERFGVVGFDKNGKVTSIEEKPKKPKSNYAVTGLYFYDNRVINFAKKIRPSDRGELEITDINKLYLEAGDLDVKLLGRGFAWLDTGTIDSLMNANDFIKIIEKRQNTKIAALEEIAYRNGWIKLDELVKAAKKYEKSEYGQYLMQVAKESLKE